MGDEGGKSLRQGIEERRLDGGGKESPIPTSGFMMSDSARAFLRQRQRPIESGVGFKRLGPGEERGMMPGL